jgi:hypothetical protein
LVHESECGTNFSPGLTNWLLHGERLWPTKFEHPIQDDARDQGFSFLRFGMTSTEPVADDRLTRYGLIGHISLKKVFSTRACWWYPDSFFHWRRPTSFTRLAVRSRALGRVDFVAT